MNLSTLLLDCAAKGAALLVLAAIVAMLLRRDSAATRHLVWLLAMVALLVVPALSTFLPRWHALPEWASVASEPIIAASNQTSAAPPPRHAIDPIPPHVESSEAPPPASPLQMDAPAAQPPAVPSQVEAPTPTAQPLNWLTGIPLVWLAGLALLLLRLFAARLLLWNTERQAGSSSPHAIAAALQAACSQLGIRRPVTLLLHRDKTIPVVWGILRSRLMLPAAAQHWSAEQLRAVLLHELAHVKRRDNLTQLLAQFAVAVHWFNPMAWYAVWRLGVEREKACDDLVLASGVRPSAYAGHLLDVVTELSSARWTHACGLAMARKSSLEGRLIAVLAHNLNRRGVSLTLVATALAIAVGVAVPLAMLRAADDKPAANSETPANAKPTSGAKLSPATEQKLRWGESVNGLRGALAIRSSDNTPDVYLVLQNVSEAPIHFSDSIGAPNLRYLTLHRDDLPQGRTKIEVPTLTDVVLQPREATFFLMIPRSVASSRGQALAAGMLKEPHMVLVGEINFEKAPAGAWLGKLITGYTNGAAAQIDPAEAPKASKASAAPHVVKLDPATEQRLKWGESVNGLRAAIIIRPSENAQGDDLPDLYLALQNVSDAIIRLSDAKVPADVNLRVLYLKIDGQIKFGLGARTPPLGDVNLQPRAVAFLPLFDPDSKLAVPADPTLDKHTVGSHLAEGALKDPRQTLFAQFEIEQAPAGAWTGKLRTGDTTAAAAAGDLPKTKQSRVLFELWQKNARLNGDIPGGEIARLADKVNEFIRNNTGDKGGDSYAKKMAPLVTRFDSTHDWKPADVVTLLDDVAAAHTIPLETTATDFYRHTLTTGNPLPRELAKAPWGEAQATGLRMAWMLEPMATEYRLGTALRSRILIQNSGKEAVVFRAQTFNQPADHKARNAQGANVKIDSLHWLTLSTLMPCRLAPGHFVELTAPGIGIGKKQQEEDWQGVRAGSWIHATAGDDVVFLPAAVSLNDERPPGNGAPDWWLDFIAERLAREAPLPAAADERKHLLEHAMRDLFGMAPTAGEIAAFAGDREPNALERLAQRLAERPGVVSYTGSLESGATAFHVLPPDPDAAKKPRTASNPGWYTISPYVRFSVTRRQNGERIVNEAYVQFFSKDQKSPPPGPLHHVKLVDGYGTWAAAWERDGTVLWSMQKGAVRRYDFTDPANVKEEDVPNVDQVPKAILDAMRAAIETPK